MRVCTICGTAKENSCFYKEKRRIDGLRLYCKTCSSLQVKKWYHAHLEQARATNMRHKRAHPEKVRAQIKKWRAENPGIVKLNRDKWINNNRGRFNELQRKVKLKIRATLKGKLTHKIGMSIRNTVQAKSKNNKHWEILVGYTVEELINYLEKLFTPNMTWDNYGPVWHIDHKIPISVFNFETPDDIDFKKCWCLDNLQPLEASKNWSKRANLTEPFQPSLLINLQKKGEI
jgi:hypothetical protein